MHCRTCANEVDGRAEICVKCGTKPSSGRKHCPACGTETPNPNQEICLACGVRVKAAPAADTSVVADLLYRGSGAVMVMSGLWNVVFAFLMFITMIWVCIGAWWIIPGMIALVQIGFGGFLIASGKNAKPFAFAPLVGFAASAMNLNMLGMMMDLVALVLGIIGFVLNNNNAAAGGERA